MEANLQLTLGLHSPPSSVPEPRGLFLCVYCGREFYNSQAFGGHQNAHKEERSLGRRRQDIAAATRAHAASLPSSAPSTLQGAARLGADDGVSVTGLFPAAKKKKARMETQLERERKRGRSFPGYGAACTDDGLDLSLSL